MISATDVRYAGNVLSAQADRKQLERLGFTRERWARYQQELNALGVVQVLKGPTSIEFRVDQGTFRNGDSYKGYEYDLVPPQHTRRELDGYRLSDNDRDGSGGYHVSKPLKGRWYLYLYING